MDAKRTKLPQGYTSAFGILRNYRFGDLQVQAIGIETSLLQYASNLFFELEAGELFIREIYTHGHRRVDQSFTLPFAHLTTSFPEYLLADVYDQACVFCNWNKVCWRN